MVAHDPGQTGFAAGTSGPIDDVEVRWKRRLEVPFGVFHPQSPVVADGIVYAVGEELVAVSAGDGTTVFGLDRTFGATPAIAPVPAYRTPTVALPAGRRTIGLHGSGGVRFRGTEFGATRWTASPSSSKRIRFDMFGSRATSPIAADGTVVSFVGGALSSIDASSGEIRWQLPEAYGRPAIRDGYLYAICDDDILQQIDLETGARTDLVRADSIRSITATPRRLVVKGIHGLVGISYEGAIEWRFDPEEYYLPDQNVSVAEGVVYVGSETSDARRLLALDAEDGSILWEAPVDVCRSDVLTPPAVSDDMVYVPTEMGELAGVDRTDGTVRWRFRHDDEATNWSAAAIVDDVVYAVAMGRSDYLYALVEP